MVLVGPARTCSLGVGQSVHASLTITESKEYAEHVIYTAPTMGRTASVTWDSTGIETYALPAILLVAHAWGLLPTNA